ncbi:fimbrial protein [Paraburkholderia flava]|uniref:fimbrial protein n=1 Tax=Paraburkholderia flava TaxID=2547393 RepID=UPI00105C7CED|nr:fimbrial protein [Paraburkholderia flava]
MPELIDCAQAWTGSHRDNGVIAIQTKRDMETMMHAFAMLTGWIRSRGVRRLPVWIMALLIGVCGLGSHTALAQSVSCSGAAQTIPISMPASTTVPRDVPVGTVLTPWVTSQAMNYFNCTVTTDRAAGLVFKPLSLTKSGIGVVAPGGPLVTVWNTNVAGVGIAIAVSDYETQCNFNSWFGLSPANPDVTVPSPWVGVGSGCNGGISSGQQMSLGAKVQIALVKTGPVTAGTIAGGVLFQGAAMGTSASGVGAMYSLLPTGLLSFSMSQTNVIAAACTTPDVTVLMGTYKSSAFTGMGSATNPVSFNLTLNSCPAGMTKIQYQFDAPGGVIDSTNGVIALTGGTSAATGIGLKLMDNSSAALKFDTQYPLSNYDSSKGGTYTIPLQAAYYQTATSVTPGAANAIVTFTMTYQ